jgi:hypothetical protein
MTIHLSNNKIITVLREIGGNIATVLRIGRGMEVALAGIGK